MSRTFLLPLAGIRRPALARWLVRACVVFADVPFTGSTDAKASLEVTVEVISSVTGTPGGTPAPGSGDVDGRPDGTFTYASNIFELGAPVAAKAGVFGATGAVELTPLPPKPSVLRGLWGRRAGIATAAIQTQGAPGTVGGFTGLIGPIVVDSLGDVVFSATWEKTTAPTATGSGIWHADLGLGPLATPVPVALSGQDAPGTGTQFGAMHGGPVFQGLRHIGFIGGGLGTWTFEKATQQLRRVTHTGLAVPAFGDGVTLSAPGGTVLGLVDGGRLLVQAATSDGKTRLFLASATDAIDPIVATGDAAPGLAGRTVSGFAAGANVAGDVAIVAQLEDGDGNPFNNIGALYLRRSTSTSLELVTHGGAPLAGMPAGLWAGIPLINDKRRILFPAIGVIDVSVATPTFTAIPAVPAAPVVPTVQGWSFNDLGQVAAYIQETGGASHSLWLYDPGDGWLKIAERGGTLMIEAPPAAPTMVNKIGVVVGSGGGDGKATSLGNDGRLVFTINGRYLLSARIALPDLVVPVGTTEQLLGDLRVNNLTVHGTLRGPGTVAVEGIARLLGGATLDNATVSVENSLEVVGTVAMRGAARLLIGPDAVWETDTGPSAIESADSSANTIVVEGEIDHEHPALPIGSVILGLGTALELASTGAIRSDQNIALGGAVDLHGLFSSTGVTAIRGPTFLTRTDGLVELSGDVVLQCPVVELTLPQVTQLNRLNLLGANVTARLSFNDPLLESLLFIDEVTVTGPSNAITVTTSAGPPPTVEISSKLHFGSGSELTVGLDGGTLHVGPDAVVDQDGPATMNVSSLSYLSEGDTRISDSFFAYGDVQSQWVDAGSITVSSTGALNLSPTPLILLPGSSMTLAGSASDPGSFDGDLRAGWGSASGLDWTLRRLAARTVTEWGKQFLNVGESPGAGRIDGDLFLGALTDLVLELGGTQQGVSYDHVDLNGMLTIAGGVLDLRLVNGFESTAQATDLFVLLEADAPVAGSFANWPSGSRRNTGDGLRSFELFYGPGSPHGAHRVVATSVAAAVAGASPPTITIHPAAQNATAGGGPTFTVAATGNGPFSYQWYFEGFAIPGATTASYTVPSAQSFLAGDYAVVVSDPYGPSFSNTASLSISAPALSDARVLNLSTRALDLTGDNVLIPGFVIHGAGTKRMLVRAVGPGLFDTFGLTGILDDPQLSLRNQVTGAEIAASDDWGTSANKAAIISTSAAVGAFPLLESSKDAVVLVDLPAGAYTAPTLGAAGGTGIAMVELYDADGSSSTAQLVNISNRGFVDVGDRIMIPGFVVSNEGSRTFLIRAVGPGLFATFGLTGVLEDPVLNVFLGPDVILSNDDWGANAGAATTASTSETVGAFPLENGSTDAAFVVTLPPGGYTIQASGKGATTGVALVEVYLVP